MRSCKYLSNSSVETPTYELKTKAGIINILKRLKHEENYVPVIQTVMKLSAASNILLAKRQVVFIVSISSLDFINSLSERFTASVQ